MCGRSNETFVFNWQISGCGYRIEQKRNHSQITNNQKENQMIKINEILDNAKRQLKGDWQTVRHIFLLEAISTMIGLTCAFLIALDLVDFIGWFTLFIAYTVSSGSLLVASVCRPNSFLILLTSGYTVINIVGLVKHF